MSMVATAVDLALGDVALQCLPGYPQAPQAALVQRTGSANVDYALDGLELPRDRVSRATQD
jgi:hypothetical protein